jgi:uncharacterized protein (TIGR00288 family)
MKENSLNNTEPRTAVLVDCDNVSPDILEYALLMAAQFGRIVLRRGYGNQNTLGNKWQEALLCQAFTPCLQYQYVNGKNTADIALSLDAQEALFDERVEIFCLVTSDSDFTYLCRKLRERGATVCIVGEAKTPVPLRNACDRFFEWKQEQTSKEVADNTNVSSTKTPENHGGADSSWPFFVVNAVSQLISNSSEEKIGLGELGSYLKRTDPGFSPKTYAYPSLLKMVGSYASLTVKQEDGGHWVSLTETGEKKLRKLAKTTPSTTKE